jgi:hypothetical protein
VPAAEARQGRGDWRRPGAYTIVVTGVDASANIALVSSDLLVWDPTAQEPYSRRVRPHRRGHRLRRPPALIARRGMPGCTGPATPGGILAPLLPREPRRYAGDPDRLLSVWRVCSGAQTRRRAGVHNTWVGDGFAGEVREHAGVGRALVAVDDDALVGERTRGL